MCIRDSNLVTAVPSIETFANIKNKKYSYIPDFGPKISTNLGESYHGETLLAMSGNLPYTELTLKESRVLMKRLIDYYIQPKNIKTREILKYISL